MARLEPALLVGALMLPTLALAPVTAQEGPTPREERIPLDREGPRSVFDFMAFVGWIAPLNDIINDPASFTISIDPSASFGLEGLGWLGRSFGIGFHGFWAGTDLNVTASDPAVEVPDASPDADYLSGSVNLLYRFPVSGPAATVQPYLLLGGGVRHLSVSESAEPAVEDATDPQLTVGMGAFVPIGSSVTIQFALRDFLSQFESAEGDSRLQNDILVSFGIGFRFF